MAKRAWHRGMVGMLVMFLGLALGLSGCVGTQQSALSERGAPRPTSAVMTFQELVRHYKERWHDQGVPVREALARLPHVGRVYTIDPYHTAVRVLRHPVSHWVNPLTRKELIALTVAYGGKPYVFKPDNLTGKPYVYENVEIRDKKDLKDIYLLDAGTGKEINRLLYNSITGQLPPVKFKGSQMELVGVLTNPHPKRGMGRELDTLIYRHPMKQPFLYRTPHLPPMSQIPAVAPGGYLEKLPVFKGKDSFASILKGFFNWNKAFIKEDEVEYALAICEKAGGRVRWLGTFRKYGPDGMPVGTYLKELKPLDGWLYAISQPKSPPVRRNWYLGCEAANPFVLEASVKYTRDRTTWWHDLYFHPGRRLTELEFVALSEEAMAQGVQELVAKVQRGEGDESLMLNLAKRTALTKAPIAQTLGPTRYESSYNGRQPDGCVLVSVTRISDTTPGKRIPALETTFNYRVCAGKVESIGMTAPHAIREDIIAALPDFARTCQRYGETTMNTVNYQLYCRPLRGESQCEVEVVVLKGGRMVEKFIYNGCTGKRLR